MKCTLILVRHGETVDNVNRIMQGQTPGRLTDNGVEQARQLGLRMSGEPIDAFVSSDLKRAVDTCVEIAAPHMGGNRQKALSAIVQTPLLRERDWGSFTGCYIPDLKDRKWTADIETANELQCRARLFLEFVKEKFDGKTVLAVGHGIINKAIQAVFYNKPMHEIQRMGNAEMRVLELSAAQRHWHA